MKRAYGSEPVLLHTSPISPLLTPSQKRRRLNKKAAWIVVLCSVLLLALLGGLLVWQSLKAADGIPPSVREAVSFPLYQPQDLPSGFAIDKDSFSASSGLMTFSVTYDQNRRLVVTEQAKPEGFDFESLHDQLTNKKDIATYVGSGATGQLDDADFASLVTPKTWVLVRAPSGIEPGKFEQFMMSFR